VLFEDSIEFEEIQYYNPKEVANIAAILKNSQSAAILTSCETHTCTFAPPPPTPIE
jgi:hypothetical protein